ncbi:uncharacterized protein LOC123705479 [Colias croceus]|uniref:uncharacterized protein LOC123705479 n=1 Tax=Colias crocea TaxID=72248 RepID=UPI001E28025D|nr:uncharacterized protein LOC123705479 [Colias croceus]
MWVLNRECYSFHLPVSDHHQVRHAPLDLIKPRSFEYSEIKGEYPSQQHRKVQRDSPICTADLLGKTPLNGDLKKLIQNVCSDSEIAKEITFEKTKAQAIVSNVTGKLSHSELVKTLQTEKFSLIVDESTDKSTTKHLALIARTAVDFNVEDNFLCLIPIVDGTASALHNECKEYFDNENIPYKENMIGFAADGANTMFGSHHSLSTLFANEIPHLFMMKCICHSFHLCASYACKSLPRGVEDFTRDVYNYIQNSPKRLGDYKEFQSFLEIKPHKLLHPAQTRWLSLLPVVKRLLEQLPALKLYFQNAVLNDRLLAAQTIHVKAMDPSTELYLNFLDYVLPYFHDINKEMQSESPKLYLLYERIFTTYKTILECFIKPELLQLTEDEKNRSKDLNLDLENKILNLEYENKHNHVPIEEIYLGGNVISLLLKQDFVAKMTQMEIVQFKEKCILFYIESVKQIKQRFCFNEKQRLKCLKFLNPKHIIEKQAVTTIAHLGVQFPGLCPENMTELDREWRLLRNITFNFPEKKLDPTPSPEEFWKHVSSIKKGDQSPMFPLLCEFVRKLLALPHSSANVERLFSAINNMKTSQRNKICTKTLEGLLRSKRFIANNGQPSAEHLKLFNKNMYN